MGVVDPAADDPADVLLQLVAVVDAVGDRARQRGQSESHRMAAGAQKLGGQSAHRSPEDDLGADRRHQQDRAPDGQTARQPSW